MVWSGEISSEAWSVRFVSRADQSVSVAEVSHAELKEQCPELKETSRTKDGIRGWLSTVLAEATWQLAGTHTLPLIEWRWPHILHKHQVIL